jgi:mannose-6-phosphate isomerase-like protein (cupin superfamily)
LESETPERRRGIPSIIGEKNMKKVVLGFGLLCLGSTAVLAQAMMMAAKPTSSTLITNADIEKVLKDTSGDHTVKTMEMGQGYQMSIGVVNRPMSPPPNAPAPALTPAQQAQQAEAAKQPACGLTAAPAGAKVGMKGMIQHDSTAETYIVIKGSGTLVTGGQILQGRRSAPDSIVTKVLNGPSCSGQAVGNFTETKMGVGDIMVIPAGVPHGWENIPASGVTYLSVRPDPKYVLPRNYNYVFTKK